MGFKLYEKSGEFHGRQPRTVPGVSVAASGHTVISIPRSTMAAAGLPDAVGAKVDVLIGNGTDSGKVAIVKGSTLSLCKPGDSTLLVNVRLKLGASRYAMKDVRSVHADNGALILSLPLDFPFANEGWETPAASAPASSINSQALAA